MEYELAKELKDAGFPQHSHLTSAPNGGCPHWMDKKYHKFPNELPDCDCFVAIPTLSELIEACGERCTYLWRTVEGWATGEAQKRGDHAMFDANFCRAEGKTPEEAVARLWLGLNRK